MKQAFVIMQIGNTQLDQVYRDVFVPSLVENKLDPKRVDKHNEGSLLKQEIITFIGAAEIIVADLTNERPNCYLEIGFAMGLDKFRNIILTCREDHNLESPNHERNGPKVHFDLAGYDILFWNPEKLEVFREELSIRISRRRAILGQPAQKHALIWDQDWIKENKARAKAGLEAVGFTSYFEFWFSLSNPITGKTQKDLVDAADKATIPTFGWPIGVVLLNARNQDWSPKPTPDGIRTEIAIKDEPMLAGPNSSYDYWSLRVNGDYFLLKNFYEDGRFPNERRLNWNTRIIRVTEALLFCARLYNQLNVDPGSRVKLHFGFSGLLGRELKKTSSYELLPPRSSTDFYQHNVEAALFDIEANLLDLVKEVCQPLFMLFDFHAVPDATYPQLVNDFVNGKIT